MLSDPKLPSPLLDALDQNKIPKKNQKKSWKSDQIPNLGVHTSPEVPLNLIPQRFLGVRRRFLEIFFWESGAAEGGGISGSSRGKAGSGAPRGGNREMRDGMRGSGLQGKVQVGNWGKFLLEKLFQPPGTAAIPGGGGGTWGHRVASG